MHKENNNHPIKDRGLNLPELLMPAGNLSKLRIALEYGADAVYVGAAGFSMRPDNASFDIETLAEAIRFTHNSGKKIYVAVNSLLFQEDLPYLKKWLDAVRDLKIDAMIVSDAGAFVLMQETCPELNIHISTQMSTSNAASAQFWKNAGAKRVILARECTLEHTREITKQTGIEVEIFVHGAMCMAISGRCLLSAHLCGRSGSRGECKHTCRWEWQLVEKKRPGETIPVFETGRETIFLGSSDLCLLEHLPIVIGTGVTSLKIEGRMKSEYYVATVARVYRAALDSYAADPDTFSLDPSWIEELEAVSHRPYSTGFAFGYPGDDPQSLQIHNHHISSCLLIGFVDKIENSSHSFIVKNPFQPEDELEWIGPNMAGGNVQFESILNDRGEIVTKIESGMRLNVEFKNNMVLPGHSVLRKRIQKMQSDE